MSRGHISFPGTNGNYLSVAHGPWANTPDDLEVVVGLRRDWLHPPSQSPDELLLSKPDTGASEGWHLLAVGDAKPTGKLSILFSVWLVGVPVDSAAFGVVLGLRTGDILYVRGVRRRATGLTAVSASVNGSPFITLNETTDSPGAGIRPSTAELRIGGSTVNPLAGELHYASVGPTPGGSVPGLWPAFRLHRDDLVGVGPEAPTITTRLQGQTVVVHRSGDPHTTIVPAVPVNVRSRGRCGCAETLVSPWDPAVCLPGPWRPGCPVT